MYRDRAPKGTALPYITVSEAIAVVPDTLEDGAASTVRETASVDVWMTWKNVTDGSMAESYSLPGAVLRALQGQPLTAAPTHVYAVVVTHMGPRLVDEEENVVHVPITVEIWRAA